jgi:TPR repeat protein
VPAHGPSAFFSYSREDSEFALRLAQDLKAAGANVWLDQLELVPGHPWDNAIEDALLAAPLMLVVLSPTSVKSENVRDEISYALKQGKTVIPVLYMECVIPLRLERKQHIDFRHDYALGLAHLLKCLEVTEPDPSVLEKAAAGDAQRQNAWQAREAEGQRLRELSGRSEREDSERTANEELQRRQEAEAARIRDEQHKAAQVAEPARMPPPPRVVPEQRTGLGLGPGTGQGVGQRNDPKKISGWVWGTLGIVLLGAVFAAGRLFAPKPGPLPAPAPVVQPQPQQTTPVSGTIGPEVSATAPAAATTDFTAIYNQAEMLYNRENYTAAAPLYGQACTGGVADACSTLGYMYMHAMGVSQDYSRAFTLNTEGCNGGGALGCNELGYMYDYAEGVQQDYSKAFPLYAKACQLGSGMGCNQLGNMYFDAKGVARDYSQAVQLYAKSCNENVGLGCDDLGRTYRDGNGVTKNTAEAKTLFQKGCNLGEQVACDDLKKLG